MLLLIPAIISWIALLTGVVLFRRMELLPEAKSASSKLPVSIIIPARNEGNNIGKLLTSLNIQSHLPGEIIVVDDGSSDATAQIAASMKARVLSLNDKPEGWTGKTWACMRGAQSARYDTLMFVDADVWFDKHALERTLEAYRIHDCALSILPYHVVKQPYESLSSLFNIVTAAGVGAFSPDPASPGGFGPLLLIDRKEYNSIGGHASVRQQVLENVFLGKRYRQTGKKLKLFPGRGTVNYRMYPNGVHELVAGWTKGFAAGAQATDGRTFALINVWLTGVLLSAWNLIVSPFAASILPAAAAAACYVLYVLQIRSVLAGIGSFPVIGALTYPIHVVFFMIVFFRSLIMKKGRRHAMWKGREIALSDQGNKAGA
ncbi:MAG: glycosyltransferase [Chitinivibrionales bacterium]|nr:glycosyltransferase [Chitinivibrionales bacterium]